ncbi:MAG: hypothetical protein ACPG19_02070 [Saprospiraceae bacterium]
MKELINKNSISATVQTIQLASDGITPYTGVTPNHSSLSMNANDEPRG